MPRLSVCIELFWEELPYEERIARVAELGFTAFEFWGWSNKDIPRIKETMDAHGIALAALFYEPRFDLTKRNCEEALLQGMRDTAVVAQQLRCATILATIGYVQPDEPYETTRRRLVRHLRGISRIAEDQGLVFAIEPLNTLYNRPNYWLTTMSQAVDIVEEVGSPAIKILIDLYHQQISEGNVLSNLRQNLDKIAHLHAAGVPGRHELLSGEQDYRTLFRAIDESGYDGYVGLEYIPLLETNASLRQALSLAQS
jgi:hydroxypyruvate isomerase